MSLFEELKRRNVFRVAIAYGVAAWLLLQLTDIVVPILEWPGSIPKTVLFLLVIGFIPAVILAWALELTPEGVKLESEVDRSESITVHTGRKLDRAIIGILVLALSFMLVDKFVLEDAADSAAELAGEDADMAKTETPAESALSSSPGRANGKSVAVLPFAVMSNGPDDDYFTDGLTEEIINALAQLPELLVTARTSAFHFKGQNVPVEEIAGQLGVAHIVEGSVRRAGDQLRITAQLIRAQDGFHLWSETYDRRTEDTFAVQEDIAEKVATALNVILDESQRQRMRTVGVRNVEAFTAFQKGRELHHRAHVESNTISDLRLSNRHFETAFELAPDFFDAYLQHSDLFTHILLTKANGQLDGNINDGDLQGALTGIRRDYELALQSAQTASQRLAARFDRALLLGEWNGLAALGRQALEYPGCDVAVWAHLTGSAFGNAQAARKAFEQLAACDPVSSRPLVHVVRADLWLEQPERAIETAQSRLQELRSPNLDSSYIFALEMAGRSDQADAASTQLFRSEADRLLAKANLSAMRGDAASVRSYLERFLAQYGPDDYVSLMLEAVRGDRNEANRLAGLIDQRELGYMTLMLAIYHCMCGTPFDLDAAPVFESMLTASGLPWPPGRPVDYPLKDW
jgi:TolB-like protein